MVKSADCEQLQPVEPARTGDFGFMGRESKKLPLKWWEDEVDLMDGKQNSSFSTDRWIGVPTAGLQK